MKTRRSFSSVLDSTAPRSARQRGVVLFIALLVMVALSLAGIALIRSSDTATIVAGNLSFTQAATNAVDRSIEQAVTDLFDPKADPRTSAPIITAELKLADRLDRNYYSCVRAANGGGCNPLNTPIPEIPAALKSKADFAASGLNSSLVTDDGAGNSTYYVIERMCVAPGPQLGSNCNLASAEGDPSGDQHDAIIDLRGGAFYRVTVRVEGPRNTVQYAQAILQ